MRAQLPEPGERNPGSRDLYIDVDGLVSPRAVITNVSEDLALLVHGLTHEGLDAPSIRGDNPAPTFGDTVTEAACAAFHKAGTDEMSVCMSAVAEFATLLSDSLRSYQAVDELGAQQIGRAAGDGNPPTISEPITRLPQ